MRTFVAVLVIQGLVLFPASLLRLIDADEGDYLMAAKLVMQGKMLYTDFLYHQMPLLPYVYGVWMKAVGFSWYSGRILSALCAIFLGSLLYCHVARRFRSRWMGLSAVFLYTFSGLVFGWYTVVKTYSFSTLCLFGAYVVLQSKMTRAYRCLLGGMLLGLAVDVRLLFLVVGLVFLIWLYVTEPDRKSAIAAQLWFLSGAVIALSPNVVFILADPEMYFFGNIGLHSVRPESRGLFGDLEQKIAAIRQVFGIYSPGGIGSLQFSILFVVNLAYVIATRVVGGRLSLAFYSALVLAVASLLPSPAHDQYFCVLVPFMVVNGLDVVNQLDRKLASQQKSIARDNLRKGLLILVAAYAAISPLEFYRYTFWGRAVPGVGTPENVINWTIPTMDAIASEIDRHATPNEPVLTWWPGYLVGSHASPFPKAESRGSSELTLLLPQDRLDRYRLMSHDEMHAVFKEHRARLVVIGNWVFAARYREVAVRNGYASIKRIGDTEIYMWPGTASSLGPGSR